MRILAATDFSTRSNRALRQAGLLAKASGAQLDIVHVVDDDQPAQMVEMERREADRLLAEQMNAMAELSDVQCQAMVVVGDPFDGILRTAAASKADLIVMGQHRRQLLRDIVVGTTIERVVRAHSFPVLMVNNEAQRRYERILIAVDMSEPSANAILVAKQARLVSENRPTLLHAFQSLAKGKMLAAGAARAAIDEHVASERERIRVEVIAFLAARGLDREQWPLRIEEGAAGEVLSRSVREMRADLLVMGTRARSGLLKVLIGSVTEEALRSLNVDILAVPPVGRSPAVA
jgi:nucleotide-binding universal stress UspA family protein